MSESPSKAVRRIASLARLEVREDEAQALATQFERILGQFQVLATLDVSGVEEGESPIRPAEQRRADLPRPSLPVEQALANAPARVEDFYRVPKTVGGEE
jgi:aspartyl-tRNA(Asn)/glutamyl-tRNA(Gln) amidotransferase subunit C